MSNTITIAAGSVSITAPVGYAGTLVINGVTVTLGGVEATLPVVAPAPLASEVYTSDTHTDYEMFSASEEGDTLVFTYRNANGVVSKRTLYITKVAGDHFGGVGPEGGYKRFNFKGIRAVHRLEKGVKAF